MEISYSVFGSQAQYAIKALRKVLNSCEYLTQVSGLKVLSRISLDTFSALNDSTLDAIASTLSHQISDKRSAQQSTNEGNYAKQDAQVAAISMQVMPEHLNRLQGDFRLMFVDQATGNLHLAVSAFNPQTLFYARLPDFTDTYIVSSDISLVLDLVLPEVDCTSLAMWLAGRPDPNRSMFENIHQVAQGTCVSMHMHACRNARSTNQKTTEIEALHSVSIASQRFWDIDANTLRNVPEYSDSALPSEFASRLNTSVQRNLSAYTSKELAGDNNENVFTQLSGGMDSTSVSALAYSVLSNADARLHSISHTYRDTKSCDESDNINAMIAKYPFAQSHFIELDKYTEKSFAELYPTHPQSPGMVLSPKYHEEAKLMQACNAKLLLTGNGGDEMCWGHSFVYYDRLKRGDIKVLSEVMKGARELKLSRWQSLKSVFLGPVLHFDILPMLTFSEKFKALFEKTLHIPPWLSPHGESMVREQQNAMANANPFSDGKHGLTRYARYEGLFNTSTFNSMRSYQAVFDTYGLQVQHPFFDKDIAEFSFAIEQHQHINGKYPKLLLRKAMTDLLPEQVCWNMHKTVFDQHFAKLVQQNAVSLRKLLEHEGLQDLGLVNNEHLLTIFDALVNSPQPSLNVDLLYAILVQSWYQTHILKLE
ncbi:asparagine synthase-related protein [Ningiella sp. W23]|uniref:asparagine synthase-related protein n=1 Tax=Ningiella sp. W23 TaxID=3023715 RepID=UPI0037579EBE